LQLKFREGLVDEKYPSRAVIQRVQQDNLQDFEKWEGALIRTLRFERLYENGTLATRHI
jgi:hypothetical protein